MYVASRLITPPSTTDLVLEAFHIGQSSRNIVAWSLVIQKYAAEAEDHIPTLEYLGGVKNGRAKSTDIGDEVSENMELVLVQDFVRINECPDVEDVCNEDL